MTAKKTPTLTINMDAPCTKCGNGGATKSGLCLGCISATLEAGIQNPSRTFKKIKPDLSTGFLELAFTERVRSGFLELAFTERVRSGEETQ